MKMNVGKSDSGGKHEKTGLRAVTSEVNILSQPDGSASFNQGDTSVVVAVYGPAEVKSNRELIDRATVDVTYKPKVGLPGCEDKYVEHVLRNTCESMARVALHPRSLLSVVVQEMQNCGAFLACCLNATCLALLDASYPMHFTIAGVACVYSQHGDFILDPTLKQEKACRAHFTFAFESGEKNVVTCCTKGVYSSEEYERALLACRQASEQIFIFYRDTMKKKLSRTV